MPAIAIAAAVAATTTVAGTAIQANQKRQAAKGIEAAAEQNKIDTNAIDLQIRDIARRNAEDSIALEKELSPETYNLRRESTIALMDSLVPSANDTAAAKTITDTMGGSSLVADAVKKAQAELALGGGLDVQTRNEVMRAAAAKAGQGTGNLGLGRDVSARDLGLSSLALNQQRLQNAMNVGQLDIANTGQRTASAVNLGNLQNQLFQRQFNTANLANSIAKPVAGMDPGLAYDIAVGNSNRNMNAASTALGYKVGAGNDWGAGITKAGGIAAGAISPAYAATQAGGGK
jgi:hypothetical protein